MKQYKTVNNLMGWITFIIAATVYCMTIEPTASFWDCPEFITTGYKLEVGHPPGAPFFMLVANLFSQFASDPSTVAKMVNYMSALMSAACILFLFWSISVGIVCGARLYEIAIIASAVVTALLFLLDLVPAAKPPYLLVLNSTDKELEPALAELLRAHAKASRVKSRNLTAQGLDLIVELRTDNGAALVSACAALPGVESVNLLAHDGEVRY